jgi:hypothetical protein
MHVKIREITPVDYPSMATLLKSEQEHTLSREFIMI